MSQRFKYPNGDIVLVSEPYYPASCRACTWQGSSEWCGADYWGDDSDVYCPVCYAGGADCGVAASLAVPCVEVACP